MKTLSFNNERVITDRYAVDLELETLLFVSILTNREVTLRSVTASLNLGDDGVIIDSEDLETESPNSKDKGLSVSGAAGMYSVKLERIEIGKKNYYYAMAIHKELLDKKGKYFISRNQPQKDLFNKLMQNYNLPLLEEWAEYLYDELSAGNYLSEVNVWSDEKVTDPEIINSRVYRIMLGESQFEEIISEGLKSKKISIAVNEQIPLEFENLDDYLTKYGHSAVKNLMSIIQPLTEPKPKVDTLLQRKKLFPKQAILVNGIVEVLKVTSYLFLIAGMGSGKSLMAATSSEKYAQDQAHKTNLKYTIGELSKRTTYRAIIMAPGHLLEKWEREVQDEIPLVKTQILTELSQVAKLAELNTVKADGKYVYIISKDFCKLDYQRKPAPTKWIRKRIKYVECSNCKNTSVTVRDFLMNGDICPECQKKGLSGSGTLRIRDAGYTKEGWSCPECGQILYPANTKKLKLDDAEYSSSEQTNPLSWDSFEGEKEVNSTCRNCNAELWVPNINNIDTSDIGHRPKLDNPWLRISFWRNQTKKTTKTVWIHKNFLHQYLAMKEIRDGEWSYVRQQTTRKISPAALIKKRIKKNFFDFLIADEAHLYKGGNSAQGNAFHTLCKVSKKKIILTGTIMGGVASDIFYLLFRLDPKRLLEKGYGYHDVLKFSREYGVVEDVYVFDSKDEYYNTSSKGKKQAEPTVRPGISPLLFSDFLLDRAVFMDLSDLSSYLPKFIEKTVRMEMPSVLQEAYEGIVNFFKGIMRQKAGRKLMSTMINTLLSFPDKPYGFDDIRHPLKGDVWYKMPILGKDNLYSKEEALINLVNQEISEGRQCVIYTTFTGEKGDKDIAPRLKELVENHCNLNGKVAILRSNTVEPICREKWLVDANKRGMKVIICNPKLVETGLDLLDYPTLIFYQTGYSLFTLWQASRRSFRLNQKRECRVFYLAYKGTLQDQCLKLMAEKKVATAAVQGQFSAEGLAAMAQGVNPQVALAQALADGSTIVDNEMEKMFAKINDANNYANMSEEDKEFHEELQRESSGLCVFPEEILHFDMPVIPQLSTITLESVFDLFDGVSVQQFDIAQSTIPTIQKADAFFIIREEEIKKNSSKKALGGQLSFLT